MLLHLKNYTFPLAAPTMKLGWAAFLLGQVLGLAFWKSEPHWQEGPFQPRTPHIRISLLPTLGTRWKLPEACGRTIGGWRNRISGAEEEGRPFSDSHQRLSPRGTVCPHPVPILSPSVPAAGQTEFRIRNSRPLLLLSAPAAVWWRVEEGGGNHVFRGQKWHLIAPGSRSGHCRAWPATLQMPWHEQPGPLTPGACGLERHFLQVPFSSGSTERVVVEFRLGKNKNLSSFLKMGVE